MFLMEKQKYYVQMGSGEISRVKYHNNDEFVIYATEEDIVQLREAFDEANASGIRTFFRAHIPIVPYHNDSSNDEYDSNMVKAYKLVHDLGDEQTKAHIADMGILENDT